MNSADKWKKLEEIFLSEVAHTQKHGYSMYSLISGY